SNNEKEPFEILTGSTDFFSTVRGIRFVEQVYKKMKKDPKPVLSGSFQADNFETPYRSMMMIPMWAAESVFGVIIIAHQTPYYFSLDKFKFIQSFIQHASLAFTNS